MLQFLIDENLPSFVPIWNNVNFFHVLAVQEISSDTDIWNYAKAADLILITRDSDFYYRYMDSASAPKIIWINIPNMKKQQFNAFIEDCWPQIISIIATSNFLIVDEEKIEVI